MTFPQAVRSALGQYATFSGRAVRSEYWWFYLFTVVVSLATAGIDAGLDTLLDNGLGVVNTIATLALLLPSLAVTARRLHDTGRSGWWMVLPVVPGIAALGFAVAAVVAALAAAFSPDLDTNDFHTGPALTLLVLALLSALATLAAGVVLLVFLCLDSQPHPNRYGPSPRPAPAPYGYPIQEAPPQPGAAPARE